MKTGSPDVPDGVIYKFVIIGFIIFRKGWRRRAAASGSVPDCVELAEGVEEEEGERDEEEDERNPER